MMKLDASSLVNNLEASELDLLITHLEQFVTPQKREKMNAVLEQRTRWLTLALEDIYQPHNASAVIRSCECFGLQDLNVIENRNAYTLNVGVVMGSSKWVNLHRWNKPESNNTQSCIENLKRKGYKIAATALRDDCIPLPELPIDAPIALLFGTEETGLSDEAIENADYCVKIPMYGFTQSFNISVSAALCMQDLMRRIRASQHPWQLSENESKEIRLKWIKGIVKNPDILIKSYLKDSSSSS